jgi:3-hydroxyisobutyrate dehydrogenase-like beta-hydroxyacid dehydrogenase
MATAERLGFIGLGVMGARMCRNLAAKSGLPVTAFDIEKEKARALAPHGVAAADSIRALVDSVDLVFMCVPGGPAVRDICFGTGELIDAARAGQVIVDMTTAPVAVDREVAAALSQKGVDFADAPVARGVPSAEDGTLAIMVGASEAVLRRIRPFLACMGTDISHCGDVGTGQVLKLMNNMLVFQNVAALAEAMAIATRAGADRSTVFEILSRGSADSFVMRRHGSHMTTGEYPDDQFPITYSLKDLGYALDLAEQGGVDAGIAKLVKARLEEAVEHGWGDLYSPAIYKLFED